VTSLLAGCLTVGTIGSAAADVVTEWNQNIISIGGPQIQRTLAMVHIAMFDALNAFDPRYTPYLTLPAAPAAASAEAAAASAAHGVLVRLFPAQQALIDGFLASSLASVPDGPAEAAGVAYGDVVAQAIYDARLSDNILAAGPAYVPGTVPGSYQLTTPGPPQPVNTNAPNWVPFALQSASQFRPNGFPALTSLRYARDLAEVQVRGALVNSNRTADEDVIARWHTEQAQFQFNRIARAEVPSDGRTLLEHARLFALLNVALADATLSVFEAKYMYTFWRPVTAIRNADIDGNPDTLADPSWSPFQTTPPHPEYPAAHGVVQAAGARVMKDYFGPQYGFSTTAPAVPGVVRDYADFDSYTDEGLLARILGGMHFRSSLEEGARQGKAVGNWVIDNYLRPLQ
jgi:tetrahydromethanopterin S-methyltransferase subunit B